MLFKIIGGLFLVGLGLQMAGFVAIPANILGILGLIAGIALLAGI